MNQGKLPGLSQIMGVARRYAQLGSFFTIAANLSTRHSDILTEKNITRAMRTMQSIPPEKRNDSAAIQKLMDSMPETDRRAMDFFFSGREAFEKVKFFEFGYLNSVMASDLISCIHYVQNLEFVDKERIGVIGFCLGGGLAYQISTMFPCSATVAFYGANPKPLETIANISGSVLGIYAGEDDF